MKPQPPKLPDASAMPARRPPGRGSELNAAEREKCCALYVQGESISRIAKTLNTSRATVTRALHSRQGVDYAQTAKEFLREHRRLFMEHWLVASEVAAKRFGSHRPALDAMRALREVELDPAQQPQLVVSVGFALPGLPQPTTPAPALPDVPVRSALPSGDK
jgi:hypothetical protein